jgi:hypothetical protein
MVVGGWNVALHHADDLERSASRLAPVRTMAKPPTL